MYNMLKLSICPTLVPPITIKMRALMWQYCGKLKYRRMIDKWVKTSSSVILQGHLYLQTSLGARTAPLEIIFPTPVLPHEKPLLLIHCYYTTCQRTSKNFSVRLAHLEN